MYPVGIIAYIGAAYVGATVYSLYKAEDIPIRDNIGDSQPSVYQNIATSYDKSIGLDETVMGINWLRWWICRQAKGRVLEVACGTGRNLFYYRPDQITSITFVDQSSEMIRVARTKWEARKHLKDASFHVADMTKLTLEPGQYDTVIQTFGLCSVAAPTLHLSRMASLCSSTGSIMLLEHGRSKYPWLNRVLDTNVEKHARQWGCYFNRDILDLVSSCRELQIQQVSRFHLGTT